MRRNSLAVTLRAPRNGLVYCSDTLMPGWHATVNGVATPLMLANYGFRALQVPAGDLEIGMVYHPPGFRSGSIVSLAALRSPASSLFAARGKGRRRRRGRASNQ